MYAEVQLGMGRTLWRSRQVAPSTIPADGCVDLIVSGDRVLLCGPQTRWIAAGASDSTGLLGLRLAPGTASALLPTDLPTLRDQVVNAQDALGGSAIPLCEALLRARDSSDPVADLTSLASSNPPEPWVAWIRQQAIAGIGADEAARTMSWSERTLRRRMRVSFGYGYTTLRRIVRAQRAHRLISNGTPLAQAAAMAGYADQPHLARELRGLIGTAPRELFSPTASSG